MPSGAPASVGEVRRRLPPEFLEMIAAKLAAPLVERALRGMGAARATTLRVNTLKGDARSLIRFFHEAAVKHRRVLWYPDAFVLVNARERDAEGWEAYREGRIYLQSLSSMAPALVLDPRPGESVLDMAAAPGSKTTQMAALMGNRGFILANELSAVRAEKLRHNLELQGCRIAELRVGRGERLGEAEPGRFDRVLLDAPCSGEGRFTTARPSTYRSWSPRLVAQCARLQRRLIASAVAAARPGGVLVYSTCTLNAQENEGVIQWALESLPLEVEQSPLRLPGAIPGLADGLSPSLRLALRILPDREHEGFFLCRLRKSLRTQGM
jgi:16S rRNA (cytosine1407-C5)-methyltransferase